MEIWKIATLFAALFFGFYNVFTKLAAGKITDQLGALVLETSAILLILGYILFLGIKGTNSFKFSSEGIIFSALGGICAAVVTVLYFVIFRTGGDLSVAGPLILVGGMLTMALVGTIFLKEGITLLKVLGIISGLLSLYLLNL